MFTHKKSLLNHLLLSCYERILGSTEPHLSKKRLVKSPVNRALFRLTILVTLKPFTQFQYKIRATKL